MPTNKKMYVNSLVHYGISNKIEEIPIPIIDKENKENIGNQKFNRIIGFYKIKVAKTLNLN